MAGRLIIIRGNSGSGKSTIAKKLQRELGYGTMLVSQDVVRREILRVRDEPNNASIALIEQMVRYGWSVQYDVIIEGILPAEKYGHMLKRLIADCPGNGFVFYFDVPFKETLRRHAMKPNSHEFGEVQMREWWLEKDYLGVANEQSIGNAAGESAMLTKIVSIVKE